MKKIMILFAALLVLAGCEKTDDCLDCGKKEKAGQEEKQESRVVFTFNTAGATVITSRAVNENATGAVHFFLFGTINYYFLVEQGKNTLTTEILAGDYDVYAVTNCSAIHAGMGKSELESLTFNGVEQDGQGRIPMSCKERIQVTQGDVFSCTINLVRAVAKVAFNVSVVASCDVEIVGYMVCNIPDKGNLFAIEGNVAREIPGAVYDNTALFELANVKMFQQTFYLPENHRGQVAGSEKHRSRSRAPENATYLLIMGRSGEFVVDYWVFLGNNTTTDYNVTRNTNYVYNVTIQGTNVDDYRVTYYNPSLDIETETTVALAEDGTFHQTIKIEYTSKSYRYFNIKVACEQGLWEHMSINGVPFVNGRCDLGDFDADFNSSLVINNKRVEMSVLYTPDVYTPQNRHTTLRFIITDEFGYVTEFTYHRSVANRVRIKWAATSGTGTVEPRNNIEWASGATHHFYLGDTPNFNMLAKATAPYTRFIGWYSDSELTQLYSSANPLYYTPLKRDILLYPKFGN